MELIKNPPTLAQNRENKLYIYQNYFDQKSENDGNSVIYMIICLVSNLDYAFENNLNLSFPAVLGEIKKQVSELYLQIPNELTEQEIIQFAADCNKPNNYARLKNQLETIKIYQNFILLILN